MDFPGGPLQGQATTATPTTLSPPHIPRAPQLSVALNTSPVPDGENVPQLEVDKAATVGKILEQIQKRLKGGLARVWEGPNGHDLEWEVEKNPSEQLAAEEVWARWCSELLVGVTYGTAPLYGSDPYWKDKDYFGFFMSDNPVVPIAMACQQLCTFALLSQGRQLFELSGKLPPKPKDPSKKAGDRVVGCTAGSNAYLPWIYDGKFETSTKFATLANAVKRKAPPERGLTPGSLFCFSPGGAGQQQGSHVAFVLRVAASIEQVQFLDTGAVKCSGLIVNSAGKTVQGAVFRSGADKASGPPFLMSMIPGNAGNYDNGLFNGNISVSLDTTREQIPFVGLGVHKVLGPKSIITGVSMARRARPLGVARLGIFKRPPTGGKVSDDDILYVSPTVQMHEPGSTDNYYVSRFMWSLREIPGYKDIQAIWQISIPQHSLVNTMRNATRDVPLKTVFEGAKLTLKPCIWLTQDKDGLVFCMCRFKTLTEKNTTTGVTEVKDSFEPKTALDLMQPLIARFKKTPHGEHYLKESLGALDSIPPYFKPW
jgi:hypothetical protein